jgi:hypothetical protein
MLADVGQMDVELGRPIHCFLIAGGDIASELLWEDRSPPSRGPKPALSAD